MSFDFWRRLPWVLFLVCFLAFVAGAAAEETEEPPQETDEGVEGSESPTDARPDYSAGLYFGHVLAIVPGKTVFVKPTDRSSSRRIFYLDSKSKITKFVEGKRKRAEDYELHEGRKIAVRYFADKTIAVADEVFLVDGEFKPAMYSQARPKRKKGEGGHAPQIKSSGESEEGGESDGGGH